MSKSINKLALICFLAVAIFAHGAEAQSVGAYAPGTAWVISSVNGDARVRSLDASEKPAAAGMELAEGMSVSTGDASRMVLTRKGDSIVVSPDSAFRVGAEQASGDKPSILQTLGTLLFSIDSSEGARNFRVRTPYLAAVIKGTVFSVSVTPDGSALHVTEGLVQVASLATGQTGLVAVGQTARVAASGGGGLNIDTGNGKGSQQKEGNNRDADDGKKENKSAAAEKKNTTPAKASANGNGAKGGLKIKKTIDAGIGNVAANTNGLVGFNGPGSAQGAQGGNGKAPGDKGNSVNARGINSSSVIAARGNSGLNSNAGGNAGGNGNGNAGGNAGGNPNNNGGGNPNNNGGGNPNNNAGGNPNNNGNGNGNS